ncbi:hypothetical protein RF11_03150 [Thelohanellus kitauei]|uniref:Uncharacterized protein n=1 Tax=Thelohanellus kitauei TaxID=669202 RepID=A0A0C2JZH6_THEKT|nr:hypothetical protein RF11_03150 [Thelohanellus kitauei]
MWSVVIVCIFWQCLELRNSAAVGPTLTTSPTGVHLETSGGAPNATVNLPVIRTSSTATTGAEPTSSGATLTTGTTEQTSGNQSTTTDASEQKSTAWIVVLSVVLGACVIALVVYVCIRRSNNRYTLMLFRH